MTSEIELTEKLLETFHLSVPERKMLNNNVVRLSIITVIIQEKLTSYGWFPNKWKLDENFNGALLEYMPDKKIKLYNKQEVSLCKYEIIKVVKYTNISKAIRDFISITFGKTIDGINIDYNS